VPVQHSRIRTLPSPVAFDADDQALLQQVIAYYHQTLGQAGWTENLSATPGPTNGIGIWSSGAFFLQVIIKVDPQTGTLVTLSWLG